MIELNLKSRPFNNGLDWPANRFLKNPAPWKRNHKKTAMKSLIVYSSLTGNTESVARAIGQALPVDIFPVKSAPDPGGYDFVCLGFWVRRAGPDPLMRRYMAGVKGRIAAFFATLAAYPASAHARKVVSAATEALAGNVLLGHFLCQGRLPSARLAALIKGTAVNPGHPLTPERLARLQEASRHPNEDDFQKARAMFQGWHKNARELWLGRLN